MIDLISRNEQLHLWPFDGVAPVEAYVDSTNRLTVQVFPVSSTDGTPWAGTLRVGLKWHKTASDPNSGVDIERNWSWIQEIKDRLWPDRIAVEVYPPEDQIVDVAPMRWLFVLPKGAMLPFTLSGETPVLRS